MPKIVDYPRRSLAQSLDLANAVDSLGGSTSEEMAAEKMGRKGPNSGAFAALIGAAVKFGFVEARKSVLAVTPLYRDFKLAYDEEQQVRALRTAFLNVPLFQRLCERFAGKPVPVEFLNKLLIREFSVPDALASRVAEFFMEGAKAARLLSDSGIITMDGGAPSPPAPVTPSDPDPAPHQAAVPTTAHYVIRVTGPGISSTVDIFSEDDLVIVDAVLSRIRRSLKTVAS